jgi:D-aspartate ligase
MTTHHRVAPDGTSIELDTMTPAVILKLDHNVMHHGGLGAIRSLGRLGVPVYGVHEGAWAPAARSRYLRGRWFWNPPVHEVECVREGLVTLAERIGRPAVLIPTDDAGAIFLAEQGESLRQWFLFPAPPQDLPRRLADKYMMHQLCRELGMPSPETALPDSLTEAEDFAGRVGFPLVAKLARPWHHDSGRPRLRSTMIVHDREDLISSYRASERQATDDGSAGLMLQEYIPGGPGHDFFFHGYCDASSICRPAFTGAKERSYPPHAGLTCLGHSQDNPVLRQQATELLARLNYRGIVDLDFRWNPRDGQYHLLDFNPRLGAQFRLFRDTQGVDVVIAQHLDLTGRVIPDNPAVSGRRFLVENYDPIAALRYYRRGELSLRSWAASLRQLDELAWFARDDLAPFGLMCVRMGWRAMSMFRRRGSAPTSTQPPQYRRGRSLVP